MPEKILKTSAELLDALTSLITAEKEKELYSYLPSSYSAEFAARLALKKQGPVKSPLAVTPAKPKESASKRAKAPSKALSKVLMLYMQESAEELQLLNKLKLALEERFSPTFLRKGDLLEQKTPWEKILKKPDLMLVLASLETLKHLPALLKFYRSDDATKSHALLNVPFILLPPIQDLQNNLQAKQEVWKNIAKIFKK